MAASLIKLFIQATASAPVATGGTVTTTVTPNVTRFDVTITAGMIGALTIIPANSFVDDNGDPVAALPALPTDGYINVYVNGVLQEAGLSVLSTTELSLSTNTIPAGVPVILEIADFSNTSSAITTEPTISALTITVIVLGNLIKQPAS